MEKRVQDYSKEILKIIRSNTSPAVMGGTGAVQAVPYPGYRYAL